MNKEHVIDRLKMLVELCGETEPDVPDDKTLFTGQMIAAKEMFEKVSNDNFHLTDYSMTDIMKQDNKLWKMRNKIKNGEWDGLEHSIMVEEVEDFISSGQKINAIKHYRHEMKTNLNTDISLREAKDYVDAIRDDMRRKGIIK